MSDQYDLERLPIDFMQYIRDLHAYANHEPHSCKLARALQIRVRVALHNSALPDADPDPVIFLQPWWYSGNNDVTRHEIAHVMLWWSGLEARILKEYDVDTAKRIIEGLCNQAIAFLRIPQPMADAAVKRYGVSAQAVAALMRQTRAPYQMAMDRLTFDKPCESRAAFLTSGKHIVGVSVCNFRLPFWVSDRVPEPHILVPQASLLRRPHGTGLLGVLTGGHTDDWYWDGA
ncbi:hypothetical protein [Deinococcus rubellus]|uniref:Uncharacterized protein n=1 Tax=Deinococcus rubellus TaxID=1889240 RepID=A0ABY5YIT6_9DEIO|nr:hypothetical protein [Deinococcus rubellus]UWX64164.1 hypothetical protein N0D28_00335 [Deinococcus rubellus]